MCPVELTGYLASALVFAAFYVRAMLPLRIIAIASNVVFIVYGHLGGMTPIVLLHAGLLPLNAWRLCQMRRSQDKIARAAQGAGPSMRLLRPRQVPRRRQGRPGPGADAGGAGQLMERGQRVPGSSGGLV
jgi:CRP/FNR family transcriptional regulator, cyclic AMP receptor protein